MKRILTTLVLGSILIWTSTDIFAEPTTLTGTVTKVRDGDTIEVGKVPIRLSGVSAPEMNEPLGPKSKSFMTDLVMGKRVRCELDGSKTHDRVVGICYLDGKDIGATVIAKGLALDCPRFSAGRYAKYEVEGAALKMKLPGYC
jgi:micrococcal nuclease